MEPEFRLFIDEFGHHDMKSSDDVNQRYLGLTGVIIRRTYEEGVLTTYLDTVKRTIFGRNDFCLHRRDIIDQRLEPFTQLHNKEKRDQFDAAVLRLVEEAVYRVFTVVIDKREHKTKYVVWQFQPYHYCMTVMLERYVQWLGRSRFPGDVIAESRGKKENKQLAKAYRRIYQRGTDHVPAKLFQRWLTSTEIKFRPKTANVTGLQLADLLANPAARDLICRHLKQEMTADFSKKIVEHMYKRKYLRNPYNGSVPGWGTKWLP